MLLWQDFSTYFVVHLIVVFCSFVDFFWGLITSLHFSCRGLIFPRKILRSHYLNKFLLVANSQARSCDVTRQIGGDPTAAAAVWVGLTPTQVQTARAVERWRKRQLWGRASSHPGQRQRELGQFPLEHSGDGLDQTRRWLSVRTAGSGTQGVSASRLRRVPDEHLKRWMKVSPLLLWTFIDYLINRFILIN